MTRVEKKISEIIFECEKCGTCCRNLIEDVGNGVMNGLFLTPKETYLFPHELVSPQLALGENKPERIISFQLNVSVCPHISENNDCRIYEKRPLACKSFPIEITPLGSNVSVKCSVIGSKMKEGEFREVEYSAVEHEAIMRLNRYLWNRLRKYGTHGWKFDLKARNWIRVK